MAEVTVIQASARPRAGKGAARTSRREGKVPGVIYGDKAEPLTIALDHNELWKIVQRGRFLSTIFELEVDGLPAEQRWSVAHAKGRPLARAAAAFVREALGGGKYNPVETAEEDGPWSSPGNTTRRST